MSRETAALGAVLLLVMTLFCAVRDVKQAENMTVSTMETLKQQCVSFNKLLTTDRIKSLFHLTDLVVDLSEDLQRDPGLVNDRFLERTADELRLNGIAVLNKNLELDASGYSRSYRKTRNGVPGSRMFWIIRKKFMQSAWNWTGSTMMSVPFPERTPPESWWAFFTSSAE